MTINERIKQIVLRHIGPGIYSDHLVQAWLYTAHTLRAYQVGKPPCAEPIAAFMSDLARLGPIGCDDIAGGLRGAAGADVNKPIQMTFNMPGVSPPLVVKALVRAGCEERGFWAIDQTTHFVENHVSEGLMATVGIHLA